MVGVQNYDMDTLLENRDDFISVVIHWDDALSFDDGDEVIGAFANGSPSAAFNRVKFDFAYSVGFTTDGWSVALDHNYGSIVPFDIAIDNIFDPETRTIKVDLAVTSNAVISGDYRVNCYIVQKEFSDPDNPLYFQANYFNLVEGSPFEGTGDFIRDYKFKNVTRAMLGGAWGSTGVIPNTTENNMVYKKQYEYTLEENYNFENFKIVGVVQNFEEDVTKRKIYNATEQNVKLQEEEPVIPQDTMSTDTMAVDPNTGIDFITEEKTMDIFPNPASDLMKINAPFENYENVNIELFDLTGKSYSRLTFDYLEENTFEVKIPADLHPGLYFIKMDDGNEIAEGKVYILQK